MDLISLKPFDMETISNSVRKTRRVLIVEECMKTGGIGASLSAVISESLFDELDHEVVRLSSQVRWALGVEGGSRGESMRARAGACQLLQLLQSPQSAKLHSSQ